MKNTLTPTTQGKPFRPDKNKPVTRQTINKSEDDKIAAALNMRDIQDESDEIETVKHAMESNMEELGLVDDQDQEAADNMVDEGGPSFSETMQDELEPIGANFRSAKDIAIHNEEPDFEKDFKYARSNLYDIIERGSEALNNIVDLAGQSQHPRSYEVVADLIRTLSQTNKDLLELNKKVGDLNPKRQEADTINNNLFVTAELTELLKGNAKDFLGKKAREVIDAEPITPLSGESETKES